MSRAAPSPTPRIRLTIFANPPDWFPDEHAPMPKVVAHGADGGVLGCASCHLASGLGHPESANLAGVSAAYIVRQLVRLQGGIENGRSDERHGKKSVGRRRPASQPSGSRRSNRKCGNRWSKPIACQKLSSTMHLMRMPLPGGGDEPIGSSDHRAAAGCCPGGESRSALRIYRLCSEGQPGQRQGIRNDRRRRKNDSMRDLPRPIAQRLGRSARHRGAFSDVSLPPALLLQGWLAPRLDGRADERRRCAI